LQFTRGDTEKFNEEEKTMAEDREKVTIYQAKSNKT
jgi:hypothetical protein